jgi:hypothetical protein
MRRSVRAQSGQATVEWSGLLLVLAIVLAGLGYAVARTEAWGLGAEVLHAIVCAVDGCEDEQPGALETAYGPATAKLVRLYSPNVAYERDSAELPVDFRRCRKTSCSNGPADPDEIDRSTAGLATTAFTRVLDRRPDGGALYIQYWFYYPESFSGGIGRLLGPLAHRWPGYHRDDWEGYQVKVGPGDAAFARATAHGGYSSGWSPATGWYRVSGGSHAGDVVGGPATERTTTASKLALVPLEKLRNLALQRFTVLPPWRKSVYRDPESGGS